MNKKNLTFRLIYIISIGISAKIVSLLSKMLLTRVLGQEAIGLFSLVNPILVLILTLSSFSLPTAVATLISKNQGKEKIILFSSLSIVILLSLFLIFLVLVATDFVSNNLLYNPQTKLCIYCFIIVIPLTSISAIIKGYFLGSNEVKLASFSQLFEECGRLGFILLASLYIFDSNNEVKAACAILSLAFGEVFQISSMIVFAPSKYHKILFSKEDNKSSRYETNQLLKIAFPLTLGRLVGSLTYCLEPIIYSHLMSKGGYTSSYIAIEYGILNSYIMPLLLMPSFVSISLSNYLLPNLGNCIKKQNYIEAKRLLKKILAICLSIGVFISFCFVFFAKDILKIIYGDVIGISYLYKLVFFFIIYYIETPIVTSLSIFNLSSKSLLSTIVSSTIRVILLLIFVPNYQVMGIALATIISVFIDVTMNLLFVNNFFKRNNVKFLFSFLNKK